jgi:peroxiredoxin Q/BCP
VAAAGAAPAGHESDGSMAPAMALGLLPGRVTYVIDGQGVVRHVFNNLLDGPAHRREALEALRRLQAS